MRRGNWRLIRRLFDGAGSCLMGLGLAGWDERRLIICN
jgi:hypothetical protein